MKVKVKVSPVQLCNPKDCVVHGTLQARILEWVAYPFSSGSSHPGIKLGSPTLQADSLPADPQGKPILYGWPIKYEINTRHICGYIP